MVSVRLSALCISASARYAGLSAWSRAFQPFAASTSPNNGSNRSAHSNYRIPRPVPASPGPNRRSSFG